MLSARLTEPSLEGQDLEPNSAQYREEKLRPASEEAEGKGNCEGDIGEDCSRACETISGVVWSRESRSYRGPRNPPGAILILSMKRTSARALAIGVVVFLLLVGIMSAAFTIGSKPTALLTHGGSAIPFPQVLLAKAKQTAGHAQSSADHSPVRFLGRPDSDSLKGQQAILASSANTATPALPEGLAFDSRNGDLYVANLNSGNVTIVDGATDTVTGTVQVSSSTNGPTAVVYDSENGCVYVGGAYQYANNQGTIVVAVINGSTNTVVRWIPVGYGFVSMAFDTGNGRIYGVAGSNVTMIDGTTDSVVGAIPVGSLPMGIAYDDANGYLYVPNSDYRDNNVTVIDGTTDTVVGSIPVGSSPHAVAYDSANGRVYVANGGSANVTVIDGSMDRVVGSISVGVGPDGVVYDSGNGNVYVANAGPGSVTVINGTSDTVVASVLVGSGPQAMAYDSQNGRVYVAMINLGDLAVIDGITNLVVDWISVSPGSSPAKQYAVTFSESGLPVASWWVQLDGTHSFSTNSEILVPETNGTYSFNVGSSAGDFIANPATGSVYVNGSATSVLITFSAAPATSNPSGLLGLPGNTGYYVLSAAFVALVAVVVVVLVFRRRRKKKVVPAPSGGGPGAPVH